MSTMPDPSEPRRILLNFEGFRSKFHIYEVCSRFESCSEQTTYVIRKQILNRALSYSRMQEIVESEPFSELQVSRDQLSHVFDLLQETHIPLKRAGRSGKDGTWYRLAIGSKVRSTVIEWWSDREEELLPVYKLRDAILKTVKGLLKAARQPRAGK